MKKIFSLFMMFIMVFAVIQPPAVEAADIDTSDFTAQVLQLTNEARAKYGLPPLEAADGLNTAAQARATEITQKFSHTRPNGQDCFSITDWKSQGYSSVGENIACGQKTPKEVVDGWMNSEGHRANILSTKFTHLGVGYTYKNDVYGHYWAQFFGGAKNGINNTTTTTTPKATTTTPKATTTTQKATTTTPKATTTTPKATTTTQKATITTQKTTNTTKKTTTTTIATKPITPTKPPLSLADIINQIKNNKDISAILNQLLKNNR